MIAGWKSVLGSLAMIAVLAQVCRAQISPAAGVDANSPAGPPSPVSANEIWSVDPITGALSVHIPFPTTPAGGRGPSVPFGLLYNSSSTFVFEAIGMTFGGGASVLSHIIIYNEPRLFYARLCSPRRLRSL